MSNDLNTILDSDSNKALVEKYLLTKFLERRDYDTVLANSDLLQRFRLPDKSGQYVEATRKNTFRRPQKLAEANPTSDPASGAAMGVVKVKLPIEFLQEYIGVGTTARLTSWIDLDGWANEDLPLAIKRRIHELTQNAFLVGRMTPGVWSSTSSTADTAFDASAEATVSLYGISFTFESAPKYYAGNKPAFNDLEEGDRASFADLQKIVNGLALAGAPKMKGGYSCVFSQSMATDLMKDDEYFAASINAFNGKGLREGQITQYKGINFFIDDEPFTEDYLDEGVRATNGQIHSAIITGKNAAGYLDLGGKRAMKPTFKVQDISKTGVEKTIGYMVPFQAGIMNKAWCAVYKAPVSDYKPNA